MSVTRIVANLHAADPAGLARFYAEVLGLDASLDMGWIAFLQGRETQKIEMHAAREGGSGTALPVISIGVDNLDETLEALRARDVEIAYGPVTEPWGLRRFFFRDPEGNLVNLVDH